MSPRPPHRKPDALRSTLAEHQRAAYREAILDAAEAVFARDGYAAVKMTDVAEATGVAVGTLYNYFENKEALFFGLVLRHRERFFGQLEAPLVGQAVADKLQELVTRCLGFVEDNGALFAVYMKGAAQQFLCDPSNRAAPCVHPDEDHHRVEAVFASTLRAAIETGEVRSDIEVAALAWTLSATTHMAVMNSIQAPSVARPTERAQLLVKLFLEGAGVR